MFYTFYQLKRNDRYFVDEVFGVGGFVIIEAGWDKEDAEIELEMLPGGLMYFDGTDNDDGYSEPVVFGEYVEGGVVDRSSLWGFERECFPGFIHYLDGRVVRVVCS